MFCILLVSHTLTPSVEEATDNKLTHVNGGTNLLNIRDPCTVSEIVLCSP